MRRPLPHTHQDATITNSSTISDAKWAAVQNWIPDTYLFSTFNTPPNVDPDAKPTAVHKPFLSTTLAARNEGINQDVKLVVLEAVPVGERVTWCHWMVTARKKTPSHDAQRTCMCSTNMLFVKKATPNLCTTRQRFCPHGPRRRCLKWVSQCANPRKRPPYRCKKCTQGYAASQDGYTRRIDEIVNDFPNKNKCINGTCSLADTLEENFFQTCPSLDICSQQICAESRNFVFDSNTVEITGFVITLTDIQSSDKTINEFRDFPAPQNSLTSDLSSAAAN